jgi:hypothetical protein
LVAQRLKLLRKKLSGIARHAKPSAKVCRRAIGFGDCVVHQPFISGKKSNTLYGPARWFATSRSRRREKKARAILQDPV